MLDEITPRAFDELWAVSQHLEPVTLADHFDRIAEILKLGFTALCGCQGMKAEPGMFEPRPAEPDEQAKSSEYVSPESGAVWFVATTGAGSWRPPATS